MSREAAAAMVETIRRRGVDDERILDAVRQVPRERFVPDDVAAAAHEDRPLPIGHGATISQPSLVARMLMLAEVEPGDRVLDVGTGSGWAAALAACVAEEVVGVERIDALTERARAALDELGIDNVEVHTGDGHDGWPDRAPYDAILVAAAATEVPHALLEQLAEGGCLLIPVGAEGGIQELLRIRRDGGDLTRERITGVRFVPLVDDR